ncbi:MAG: type II/IV secretion system protein [Candidatus Aureabacteria bacterium]|nr:type II/IV secretion system protein [Candidatus Auribacterota bacterium]
MDNRQKDLDILQHLVDERLLSKDEFARTRKSLEEGSSSLASVIFKNHFEKKIDILNIIGSEYSIPVVDLHNMQPDQDIINEIPPRYAMHYNCFPFSKDANILHVAVENPLDIHKTDEISMILDKKIKFYAAEYQAVLSQLKKYYGIGAETVEQILDQTDKSERLKLQVEKAEEKIAMEESSMIKFVNQIIFEGIKSRATDIHIEPFEDELRIRYRVDGVLHNATFPASIKEFTESIISRIKIMANLNIAEKRLPQDGRIMLTYENEDLDLRISVLPAPFGEAINIRILRGKTQFIELSRLGLSKENLDIILSVIKKPHGVILVTGPTGSGKTTTLYAFLTRLNRDEKKIITIEDPIEYMIHGVIQLQVNQKIKFHFGSGLKSILRHDPDIIMVGEIRDLEEADITIRAALTGHLVFSTLHTNDAPSAITRLTDIGIEPYLVSSSVECVIAQRLIRLNCEYCKEEYMPSEDFLKRYKIEIPTGSKFVRGKSCKECDFTGYHGRIAIYEIMVLNDALRDMISSNVPASKIKKKAIELGMVSLFQNGMEKTFQGLTTIEEVLRVTEDSI